MVKSRFQTSFVSFWMTQLDGRETHVTPSADTSYNVNERPLTGAFHMIV